MYFKIEAINDPMFSYKICKNPHSKPFERQLSDERKVIGKFEDGNDSIYEVFAINSDHAFIKYFRTYNSANYLDPNYAAVCPFNLRCLDEVLRSAIRGNPSGITEDEFNTKHEYTASIGAFVRLYNWFYEMATALGLHHTRTAIHNKNKDTVSISFSNIGNPMSLTEFLQKVYLLSYAASSYISFNKKANEELVAKFFTLSESWIDQLGEHKELFISKLLGMNKKYAIKIGKMEKFGIEAPEPTKDVHDIRHQIGYDLIKKHNLRRILDLGSSSGQFYKKLNNRGKFNYTGIDIDNYRVNKSNKKADKGVRPFRVGNILYPDLKEGELDPELLLLFEVIEHFDEKDRQRLLYLVRDYIQPQYIVLTAPNIGYNVHFDNLYDTGFRHQDHKTEYTEEEFQSEVIDYLGEKYEIERHDVHKEHGVLSFAIVAKRIGEYKLNKKTHNNLKDRVSSFNLPHAGYKVTRQQIVNGMCSRQVQNNGRNIFYLGPTIPPVDYYEGSSLLEEPAAAFKYYLDRGIRNLRVEYKYMGSRGYILAFRNIEIANRMGYNSKIVINSRNGYNFFNESEPLEIIYNELYDNEFTYDIMMFDSEIMPWSYKAKGLIEKQFYGPAISELYTRVMRDDPVYNVSSLLHYLDTYASDGDLQVKLFNTLALANYDTNKGRLSDVVIGPYTDFHFEEQYTDGVVTHADYIEIDAMIMEDRIHVENIWYNFTNEQDGEGFVVKPAKQLNYTNNGFLIQPALKVRGREYLRLVYGPNYTHPDNLPIIAQRNIAKKRFQAALQYELSLNTLRAFVSRDNVSMNNYINAFIGVDSYHRGVIDATL